MRSLRYKDQGVAIGRCTGYRSRLTSNPGNSPVIFIDGRLVGKPVCCRCLASGFLNATAVVGLLQVTVPEGYRAIQARVRSQEATTTLFHGLSDPESDDDDDCGSDEDHDGESGVPDEDEAECHVDEAEDSTDQIRSRSPRGRHLSEPSPKQRSRKPLPELAARRVATPCRNVSGRDPQRDTGQGHKNHIST